VNGIILEKTVTAAPSNATHLYTNAYNTLMHRCVAFIASYNHTTHNFHQNPNKSYRKIGRKIGRKMGGKMGGKIGTGKSCSEETHSLRNPVLGAQAPRKKIRNRTLAAKKMK
jgi:hypothetical protein